MQRIRTSAEIRIRAAIPETAAVPVCSQTAPKAIDRSWRVQRHPEGQKDAPQSTLRVEKVTGERSQSAILEKGRAYLLLLLRAG